jgi:cytidylate kinase
MSNSLFDRCSAYLLAQSSRSPEVLTLPPIAVTISREAGAGAVTIAQQVADYLQAYRADPHCPWAVFDKNLVHKVLEDHRLPKHVEAFFPENTTSRVVDTVEDLIGLHPTAEALVRQTSETIFRLALRGNVILVGRGANIITASLKHVIHIRLVAPFEQRVRHVRQYYHLSREAAEKFVVRTDRARRRYVKRHFRAKIDDPLTYDLTINTGRLSFEDAAVLIGSATLRRCG